MHGLLLMCQAWYLPFLPSTGLQATAEEGTRRGPQLIIFSLCFSISVSVLVVWNLLCEPVKCLHVSLCECVKRLIFQLLACHVFQFPACHLNFSVSYMSLEFSVSCMSLEFSVTCMSLDFSVTYLHVSYVKQPTVCIFPCETVHRLHKGGLALFSRHRICSCFYQYYGTTSTKR